PLRSVLPLGFVLTERAIKGAQPDGELVEGSQDRVQDLFLAHAERAIELIELRPEILAVGRQAIVLAPFLEDARELVDERHQAEQHVGAIGGVGFWRRLRHGLAPFTGAAQLVAADACQPEERRVRRNRATAAAMQETGDSVELKGRA